MICLHSSGYDLHDCDSEVLRDESIGVLSSRGTSWIRGSIRGVPSNSAHPPLKPISTTRSSIRPISSFLDCQNSVASTGEVRVGDTVTSDARIPAVPRRQPEIGLTSKRALGYGQRDLRACRPPHLVVWTDFEKNATSLRLLGVLPLRIGSPLRVLWRHSRSPCVSRAFG